MLWGLVTGDCLGSPLQFTEMDSRPTVTEMEPCSCFNTPPGYWTDDASMAFCIMESRVRMGRYDLTDIGNNFVKWYRDGDRVNVYWLADGWAVTDKGYIRYEYLEEE